MKDATSTFIKSLKEPTQSQVMAQNLNSIIEVYDYIVNRTNGLEKESNNNKFQHPKSKFNNNNNFQHPRPNFNNFQHPKTNFNNFQHTRPNFNNNNNYKYSRPHNNYNPRPNNNFHHPRPFKNIPPRSAQTQREHSPMDCSNNETHFLDLGQDREVKKK